MEKNKKEDSVMVIQVADLSVWSIYALFYKVIFEVRIT